MTTNSELSVKCRHCGEAIVQRIDECATYWVHRKCMVESCICTAEPEPPIRTVLSAEDRERLKKDVWLLESSDLLSSAVTDVLKDIKAVLANAGGGE